MLEEELGMKKIELLSPVGDEKSLYQAIHNGCDALYLSGTSFGARKYAPNFTNEALEKATKYCHLYGVKIYVTVNTLIKDSEMEELTTYIDFLYRIGVDALIMQDLGAIAFVRKRYPDFEIHASTQLHNHNIEDLKLLKKLGVKRCVLARELSLEEIKDLGDIIDLEVFVHGALCISYSGQCLFSSKILDRSGNRGSCAGFCRLPYTLEENGQVVKGIDSYLLSPRELNTLPKLNELLALDNVTSFKIEGRMKSPEYVGFVTRLYRKAIDSYYLGKIKNFSSEDEKHLEVLYNRTFTLGHLFHAKKDLLMNGKTPNHIGIPLGKVIEVNPRKIKILLEDELNQNDGVRFPNDEGMIANFIYNKEGKLISSAKEHEVISLDNKVGLVQLGEVRKTLDQKLLTELDHYEEKKIPVEGKIIVKVGEKLQLELTDGLYTVQVEGSLVEEAKTAPLSEERIKTQMNKIQDTPFVFTTLLVMTDHAFVPMSALNEIRREAITKLVTLREGKKREKVPCEVKEHLSFEEENKVSLSVSVRTKEQYEIVKRLGIDRIYVSDEVLYNEERDVENVYLRLSRVKDCYQDYQNERLLIGEIGGLHLTSHNQVITDYFTNAYNAKTVSFFLSQGVQKVTLSVELKKEEISSLIDNFKKEHQKNPPLETVIYGRIELMIMKHCPVSTALVKSGPCSLCKQNKYALIDRNQKKYPLIMECPYTHIFHHEIENHLQDIPFYLEKGIKNFRVELFDEKEEEITHLLSELKKMLG